MTDPEPSATDVVEVIAEATATHPAGTELDDNGDPIDPE
jgi:hypothetical protein